MYSNYPPEFGWLISRICQLVCVLVCAPLLLRLFMFYNNTFKEGRAKTSEYVRPALALAYTILTLLLVIANIYFLPHFSTSVITVLPPMEVSKSYFIYTTHSIVISAFIINYTNSVETLQELEHGRYGGNEEWGSMIADAKPFVQWADTVARLLIGASFVWLEHNLWVAGRIDLSNLTVSFASPDQIDIPVYRGLLGDIADAAFTVYTSLALWFLITLSVMVAKISNHFTGESALRLVWRQMRIIVFGIGISAYTLYIARGELVLYRHDNFLKPVDNDWVFAFALIAATLGVSLVVQILRRTWRPGISKFISAESVMQVD